MKYTVLSSLSAFEVSTDDQHIPAPDVQAIAQAEAIVNAAHAHAAQTLQEAKRQEDSFVQAGKDEGLRRLAGQLTRLTLQYEKRVEALQPWILDLVSAAVVRLMGEAKPELVLRLAEEARELLAQTDGVEIRVANNCSNQIRHELGKLFEGAGIKASILTSHQLTPGEAIYVSSIGRVDATIDVVVSGIRSGLEPIVAAKTDMDLDPPLLPEDDPAGASDVVQRLAEDTANTRPSAETSPSADRG